MGLDAVHALIDADMRAVNRVIRERLSSDVALINQLGHYIVNSGGKRLRPTLALLSARGCGYEGDHHVELAAIVEFIHTATLLHDDVVDGSELRRGQETANAVWGNEASVLVGDFLYSRAFQMMVAVSNMRIMEIMAHATNAIAEGEVLQLLNTHDAETTKERYLEVIQRKTAKLFEAGSQLGAVVADQPHEVEQALAAYGLHLGTAFQLIDDVLDYQSNPGETGKNLGDDLSEGKPTLPLIYAMEHGNPEQSRTIRQAIETGGREHIEHIRDAVESTGAITYTHQLAVEQAERAAEALTPLPASPYKTAMESLARFSVERTY